MEELKTSLDASAASWLNDLEIEDYNLFPQCHLSLLDNDDQELFSHDIASFLMQPPLCSESNSPNEASTDEMSFERPTKQLKTTSWNSSNNNNTITQQHFSPDHLPSSSSPTTTSQIFSFHNTNSNTNSDTNMAQFYGTLNSKQKDFASVVSLPQQGNANLMAQTNKGSSSENQNFETKCPQGTKRASSHTQDHIIAERKRRQTLSQSLIALAALIPGLKKKDKASVLREALKYIKNLKERLRLLEEESKNRALLKSVVIVKKPKRVNGEDDCSSSCDESLEDGSEALLFPHVDARVSDKEVLLRIHCQKQNGFLVKLLDHIKKLNLFVVNSSVLPFGKNNSIIDITIVAKMGTGYNLTVKDLVANLRVAAMNSMSQNHNACRS